MSRSLELIEIAHGVLRGLPDCRLWGVDDGALVLGEDATQYVFCWHGALTGGMVPVVVTRLDPLHRMMSTIRHNRARGTHAVLRMAEIVRRMVADGVPEREIQKRLGMEREEVTRLVNRAGMPAQAGGGSFNRAWIPGKD
jgi:hypothetical protein